MFSETFRSHPIGTAARRCRSDREGAMMRRVLLATTIGVLLAATPALACSCGPPNPKRVAARVEVLFEGRVLDQRPGVDLAGRKAAVIRVRVDRMVRGHMPRSRVITLFSAPHPASCGVDYSQGFTGRFGASMHTGGLYTSSCTQFNLNLDHYRR
jgi:hypothetical protein